MNVVRIKAVSMGKKRPFLQARKSKFAHLHKLKLQKTQDTMKTSSKNVTKVFMSKSLIFRLSKDLKNVRNFQIKLHGLSLCCEIEMAYSEKEIISLKQEV